MSLICDRCGQIIAHGVPRILHPMPGGNDLHYHTWACSERKAENSNPSDKNRPSG